MLGRKHDAVQQTEAGDRRPDRRMPSADHEAIVEQGTREQPEDNDVAGRQRDQGRAPPCYLLGEACGRAQRIGRGSQCKGCRQTCGGAAAEVAQQHRGEQQQHRRGPGAQGKVYGRECHAIGFMREGKLISCRHQR